MDERSLILNAIKQKNNTPKVDEELSEPDAIDKWVKRKQKRESYRYKPSEDWTNVDFLRYLDAMLKDFGASRVKRNIRQDSDQLDRVHDSLADHIELLDNKAFKQYLEWWCSIWAPRHTGGELYLSVLQQEHHIKLFAKRYKERPTEESLIHEEQVEQIEVTDDNIYDLGGLDLLVLKRGIVIGLSLLKKRMTPDPSHEVRKTLSSYSRDSLIEAVNATVHNSPYANVDKIDFLALVRPFLIEQKITDYTAFLYTNYFKET